MSKWAHFNICLRERIDSCQCQLALIDEMYEYALKRDPLNVARRANILATQQLVINEITRLVGLMAKYQTTTTEKCLVATKSMNDQLN